jgi:hypothetical protein
MIMCYKSKHNRKRGKKSTRVADVRLHNLGYYRESMINPSRGAVELMRPAIFSEAPLGGGGGGGLGFSSAPGAMDGTPGLVLDSPLGGGGVERLGLFSAPPAGAVGTVSPVVGGGGVSPIGGGGVNPTGVGVSPTGVGAGTVVLVSGGGGDIGDEIAGASE